MSGSVELQNFAEESIRLSQAKGYDPTAFTRMRADLGTVEAMKKLVVRGTMRNGFLRLKELGLLEWSIEAGVLKFPDEFTLDEQKVAKWSLEQAGVEIDLSFIPPK